MYKTYRTPEGTYYVGDAENNASVEVPPESVPVIEVLKVVSLADKLDALTKAVLTGDKTDLQAIAATATIDVKV